MFNQNVARCNRYQGWCDTCEEREGFCLFRQQREDSAVVRQAIANIGKLLPDYWEKTLNQRLCTGTGSVYQYYNKANQLENALVQACWIQRNHPAVKPGCTAYVTTDVRGGCYGMVPVADQPDDAVFEIQDQKNTGKVSLVLKDAGRIPAEETWLIVGEEQGKKVVFTFHPGEPVPPATTSTDELPVGTTLTKAEALALGFNMAKVG